MSKIATLTDDQQRLLLATWLDDFRLLYEIGQMMYKRVFEKNPQIKQQYPELKDQNEPSKWHNNEKFRREALTTIQVLSKAVLVLTHKVAKEEQVEDLYSEDGVTETFDDFERFCKEIGGLHKLLTPNLESSHFGVVLSEAPAIILEQTKNPEMDDATRAEALQIWKDVCEHAGNLMATGFENGVVPTHPKLSKAYQRFCDENGGGEQHRRIGRSLDVYNIMLDLDDQWYKVGNAVDVYNELVNEERKMILPQYFNRWVSCRLELVNWVTSIARQLVSRRDSKRRMPMCATTVHMAVYMMDRYLDSFGVPPDKVDYVAAVALVLAAKIEEEDSRHVNFRQINVLVRQKRAISYPTYGDFAVYHYKQLERQMIEFFGWRFMFPTMPLFAPFYVSVAVDSESQQWKKIVPTVFHTPPGSYVDGSIIGEEHFARGTALNPIELIDSPCQSPQSNAAAVQQASAAREHMKIKLEEKTNQLMELALKDPKTMRRFRPSIIAASCVAVAREHLQLLPGWSTYMAEVTGLNGNNLTNCCVMLHQCSFKYSNLLTDKHWWSSSVNRNCERVTYRKLQLPNYDEVVVPTYTNSPEVGLVPSLSPQMPPDHGYTTKQPYQYPPPSRDAHHTDGQISDAQTNTVIDVQSGRVFYEPQPQQGVNANGLRVLEALEAQWSTVLPHMASTVSQRLTAGAEIVDAGYGGGAPWSPATNRCDAVDTEVGMMTRSRKRLLVSCSAIPPSTTHAAPTTKRRRRDIVVNR